MLQLRRPSIGLYVSVALKPADIKTASNCNEYKRDSNVLVWEYYTLLSILTTAYKYVEYTAVCKASIIS